MPWSASGAPCSPRRLVRENRVVVRPERVVADHQVGTVLDRDVEVGGPPYAAVDVVDALDAGGL